MKLQRLTVRSIAFCLTLALGATASRAADAKPDLSSPKTAAAAFGTAMLANDGATMRATSFGTDGDYKILDAISTMVSAMKKMSDAAAEKWGKDNLITKSGRDMDITAELEKSDVKVDGDNATIINKEKPDEKSPLKLKKKDNEWKVDLTSLPREGMDTLVKIAPAMTKAASDTTAEIKAGKHAKAEDAQKAMGDRMLAAMMQPPAPQPQP